MKRKIFTAPAPVLLAWALLAAVQFGGQIVAGGADSPGGAILGPSLALAAEGGLDIEVDVDRGHGHWYDNPVWIVILVLGGLVLIMLIVMAARGGGGGRAPSP